ncbi:hypothetical protein QR680_011186 [Steinernema hermaphroditum]|uniref:Acetyl-CoA acetyltransferase n=1 Tax=Steinernema hermaphroditum TaxID=289476 RepID=A0AA39MCS6_9BILA|nr:hypothetical protein QR680_011186 [Steinernema hermaphroditum]
MFRLVALYLAASSMVVSAYNNHFELDHLFSETVKPCDDFYEFVCNNHGNGNDSFMYNMKQAYNKEIRKHVNNYSDPVLDFFREIVKRDHFEKKLFEMGKRFASDISRGTNGKYKIYASIVVDHKTKVLKFVDSYVTEYTSIECSYDFCPSYIKGVVDGYNEFIDLSNRFDEKTYKIVAKYREVEASVTMDQIDEAVFNLTYKDAFAPYLNLITAKVATENDLWLPKDIEENFEKFSKDLKSETVRTIMRQKWIPSETRKHVADSIQNINTILSFPQSARNLTNIKKAMSFYTEQFEKNEQMLRKVMNESQGILKKTRGVIVQAMNRYRAAYEGTKEYVDIWTVDNTQYGLYVFNAVNEYDTVMIWPALSYYINKNMPTGFIYGQIAQTLAHEIFHSLDSKIINRASVKKAANELIGLARYDDTFQCYKDYYESFTVAAPNGTSLYQDKESVRREGFCDVEGARVAFRVVMATLFRSPVFKSALYHDKSSFSNEQWFFIGGLMMTCGHERSPLEDYVHTKNGAHPRPTIRMNAWVQQLDEFTNAFGCRPKDRMYVLPKKVRKNAKDKNGNRYRFFGVRTSKMPAIEVPDVYIVSGVRTPIASFRGSFSTLSSVDLGQVAVSEALKRSGVKPEAVDETIVGSVLTAGHGQNVARQIAVKSGIPNTSVAFTVNKVCSSGLKAVILGSQTIQLGNGQVVVAAGTESMSQVPFYMQRSDLVYGDVSMADGIQKDGLKDAELGQLMGVLAEKTVKDYKLTREEQDRYAIQSYHRAAEAWKSGALKEEVVPVTVKQRRGADIVPSLRPVFINDGTGTITPANASSMNDGAAALVLVSGDYLKVNGTAKPLAKIIGFAEAGCDHVDFTIAPVFAVQRLLKKTGISKDQIAKWEVNEAFAVTILSFIRDLGLTEDKVNTRGGAVALGHPLGMSGARIVVTLVHQLKEGEFGVAAICNGGGEATAILVQRC